MKTCTKRDVAVLLLLVCRVKYFQKVLYFSIIFSLPIFMVTNLVNTCFDYHISLYNIFVLSLMHPNLISVQMIIQIFLFQFSDLPKHQSTPVPQSRIGARIKFIQSSDLQPGQPPIALTQSLKEIFVGTNES